MLTIDDALLLEWFFYFRHLPNFDVSHSPSQISFWIDLVAWGTQSLFQDTKDCSCPPRTWCVYMGVGVRGFKEPIDSIIPPPPNPRSHPLMLVDSFILYDLSSPLEPVHVFPAFPFPLPGALTLRQRNAFLKRWVISHPFLNCFFNPWPMLHSASLIPFVQVISLTFVPESNLF